MAFICTISYISYKSLLLVTHILAKGHKDAPQKKLVVGRGGKKLFTK